MERCSQLDVEIEARQQQFGVELYDLMEELDFRMDNFPNTSASLKPLQIHWEQVNDDILKYNRRKPENNKRRRKLRVGSITSAACNQWGLQRKQKFGVECFDIVFDVLGTSHNSPGTNSLLSKEERKIHALINKAVQAVLELERNKETIVNEEVDMSDPCHDHHFCGSLEVLCPIYSLCA